MPTRADLLCAFACFSASALLALATIANVIAWLACEMQP